MLKSLYSGISGMKGFQTKLDVIGNNIANVNTIGFKKGRVEFQDILNQNISGATAPNAQGGINPKQIGLGSRVSSIDTLHTPGSPMTTGVGTDLAIDGDAYFVVSPTNGGPTYLTKAGNFTRDAKGDLVNSNGYYVLAVTDNKDASGNYITYPINITKDGVTGNDFTSFSIDMFGYINVVDTAGNSGKLAYDATNKKYYLNNTTTNTNNLSISTTTLSNPGGLDKVGNSMYKPTMNSGTAKYDRIENNKGGYINAGILEMSNVDLTEEFTEMIVAQRGFQANARTITTSDSLLEEIVNLKR